MNAVTMMSDFGVKTMSSREIADLCEKRHDNVMRDIKEMLVELHGESNLLKFEGVYRGGNGEDRPCFNLPKRETLILVSGYRLGLRAKIIDRWQELESQTAIDPMRALNDPATLRQLLAGYSEKVEKLEAVNAELTPKARALDRIATASGSLCVTDAAKALQMKPSSLFNWLHANGWIYRRHGTGWLGYSDKTQRGWLEHKLTTISTADGVDRMSEQVRITPKGIEALSRQIA